MCKKERDELVVERYNLLQSPSDRHQYHVLASLEKLSACYEHASQVEYIDASIRFSSKDGEIGEDDIEKRDQYANSLRLRKQEKIQNHINSLREIDKLEYALRDSNEPYALYWKWTRQADYDAAEKLEEFYDKSIINNHDLLFYISQYTYRKDTEKSLKIALKALENYPAEIYEPEEGRSFGKSAARSETAIHIAIFQSLVHHYYKENNYQMAYVFTLLLEMNNNYTSDIGFIEPSIDKSQISKLMKKAKKINSLLKNGKFTSSAVS
jgi:hypothetical protein